MIVAEWILAFLGHAGLACMMFNHAHAYSSPTNYGWLRRLKRIPSEIVILGFAILPIPLIAYVLYQRFDLNFEKGWNSFAWYVLFCQYIGAYFALRRIYRALTNRLPINVTLKSSKRIDVEQTLGMPLLHGTKAKLLNWIPGNQATQLEVEHWEHRFEQLPAALNGFKICQLTDLHFTGNIDEKYFQHVVEIVNLEEPDLIVITGDLVDENRCLDWIPRTLAKLTARHGVFFVLGNHDLKIADQQLYHELLSDVGINAATANGWIEIAIGDAKLFVAGNALPWYQRQYDLPNRPAGENHFSILLSHSPDQIGWAVRRKVDLMFAGHTHGGQIRFPIAGPVIAPSCYGIKYASGIFKIRETLMHVSRGVSGDEPIRVNCPPEVGFFVLLRDTK